MSLEANLGLDFQHDSSSCEDSSSIETSSRGNSLDKNNASSTKESSPNSSMGVSDRVEEELSRLWDSGQEWILIFDNLLKHPGGKVSKGCKCDMCKMQKLQASSNAGRKCEQVNNIALGTLEKSRSGAASPNTMSEFFSGKVLLKKFLSWCVTWVWENAYVCSQG